jgi:hypothetical protein
MADPRAASQARNLASDAVDANGLLTIAARIEVAKDAEAERLESSLSRGSFFAASVFAIRSWYAEITSLVNLASMPALPRTAAP